MTEKKEELVYVSPKGQELVSYWLLALAAARGGNWEESILSYILSENLQGHTNISFLEFQKLLRSFELEVSEDTWNATLHFLRQERLI